jgi:hypothetical protein
LILRDRSLGQKARMTGRDDGGHGSTADTLQKTAAGRGHTVIFFVLLPGRVHFGPPID